MNGDAPASAGGAQAVHAAASHGDWPGLLSLLKSGESIDARDEDGDAPLHIACRLERVEAVRKLIQMGANVEAANDAGLRPLMAAVLAENLEIVQALIKARANVKAVTTSNGQTVLHWAVAHPPKKTEQVGAIVQALVGAGAEVNGRSRDGTTPLMQAAWFGSEAAVEVLLAAGAKGDLRDERGRSASELARERGFMQVAERIEAAVEAAKNVKKESLGARVMRWWRG